MSGSTAGRCRKRRLSPWRAHSDRVMSKDLVGMRQPSFGTDDGLAPTTRLASRRMTDGLIIETGPGRVECKGNAIPGPSSLTDPPAVPAWMRGLASMAVGAYDLVLIEGLRLENSS